MGRVGQGRTCLWWVVANRSTGAQRLVTKLKVDQRPKTHQDIGLLDATLQFMNNPG